MTRSTTTYSCCTLTFTHLQLLYTYIQTLTVVVHLHSHTYCCCILTLPHLQLWHTFVNTLTHVLHKVYPYICKLTSGRLYIYTDYIHPSVAYLHYIGTLTPVVYLHLLFTYTYCLLTPVVYLQLLFTYTCCLLTTAVDIIYLPSNSSSKNILTTISIFGSQLFIQCISLHLRSRHPGVAPFL